MTKRDFVDRDRRAMLGAGGAFMLGAALWPASGQAQAGGAKIPLGTIGAGHIGSTIGGLWIKDGHKVMFSDRHPEQLKDPVASLGPLAQAGTIAQAIAFGEAILLTVPYGAIPQIGHDYAAALKGKIVLDTCNAVPARDGAVAAEVEQNGIGVTTQKYFPGARIVRAFNTMGYMYFAQEANRPDPKLAVPIAWRRFRGGEGRGRARARRRLRSRRRRQARRRQAVSARRPGLRPARDRGRTETEAVIAVMSVENAGEEGGAAAVLQRWVARAVPATPQERAAALWSFAYFFMLLAGYYVLRPLRDEMGIACGIRNLPWLFTATFVTLLVAQPLYGELVARLPRARFIPIVYHFFAVNLALFWVALTLHAGSAIVARVFYIWVAVFSLFAVAVFWSFMADLFTADQGKRLFGFIGAGGTAGALLGPVITIWLSVPLGPVNLLLAAIVLLEAAVFCVWRLERAATVHAAANAEPARVGGSAFAALPELIRSPYLLGIAAWISLQSFCATILYLQQIHLVAAGVHGAGAQTRVFASIDLAVNLLTLATQIFATGHLLKRFGTGLTAAALPAIYVLGFGAVFLLPTLAVVLVVQVIQRWFHFSVATPARQVFYTVLGREEKYKAKNLIDVVVYRGSDALYSWAFDSLQALGLKLGAIALVAAPMAAVWLILSVALGRAQERRARLAPGAANEGG